MKSLLLLLASLLLIAPQETSAQSRFTPDLISIEYAQCKGDSATADVLLINRGTTLEILDLRFADSNRTWEMYDTSGTYTFLKGAVILAGDTLALRLRQRRIAIPGTEWYRDTLVTSGAATSDTLLLNSRIMTSDLRTDLTNVDLGITRQNDSVSHSFTVWNDGTAPHIFDYVLTSGWSLEGIAIGDTLLPGDSVQATLRKLSTSGIGTFNAMLTIVGDCDALAPVRATIKIVPLHAYWVTPVLVDTVTGCDGENTFIVSIANGSATPTRVDSVQFIGQGEPYWYFSVADVFPAQIAAGETAYFTLRRYPGATSTKLVIHSDKPGDDTLTVAITSMVTRPRIVNFSDTVILNVAPNEAKAYDVVIQNQGPGLYRLTDFQLESSTHWSVLGFDTITTAGQSKTLKTTLVFAGSSSEGDFPARISIQGSECDTILSQVIVARVAMLSVAEDQAGAKVQVYPSIASTSITIRVEAAASYSIYDVLGNEMMKGTAGSMTTIDVSSLATGSYFVRVDHDDHTVTIPIVVRR